VRPLGAPIPKLYGTVESQINDWSCVLKDEFGLVGEIIRCICVYECERKRKGEFQ
jgi:hypothetical protein